MLVKPSSIARTIYGQYFDEKDYEQSSFWDKKTQGDLQKFLPTLEVRLIGYMAGDARKTTDSTIKTTHGEFDIGIYDKDVQIAQVEVTNSPKWRWEGSRYIPISYHKGEYARGLKIPSWCVFYTPLDGRVHWLPFSEIWTEPHEVGSTTLKGKSVPQHNNRVPPHKWHEGLESLANEINSMRKKRKS